MEGGLRRRERAGGTVTLSANVRLCIQARVSEKGPMSNKARKYSPSEEHGAQKVTKP